MEANLLAFCTVIGTIERSRALSWKNNQNLQVIEITNHLTHIQNFEIRITLTFGKSLGEQKGVAVIEWQHDRAMVGALAKKLGKKKREMGEVRDIYDGNEERESDKEDRFRIDWEKKKKMTRWRV